MRITILFMLLIMSHLLAEEKSYLREYTYEAYDYDTKETARVVALTEVKRLLLEEVSVYMKSETEWIQSEVKINGEYIADELREKNYSPNCWCD